MRCAYCGEEIMPGEKHRLLSCDGDFIHDECLAGWEKRCATIDGMSDEEFEGWMLGDTPGRR